MFKDSVNAWKALYGQPIEDGGATKGIGNIRSSRHGQISKPGRMLEAKLQMQLVAWMLAEGIDVVMIGNEGKRTRQGHWRAKQMGLRPGASDLFIAHCVGGYGGFWVELKRPGEKPRPNQVEFLEAMRKRGYLAEWYDNFDQAQYNIKEYLKNGRI